MSFTRVLICGDRYLVNWPGMNRLIGRLARRYGRGKLIIIHGGAPGIDRQARDIARTHGIHAAEVTAPVESVGFGCRTDTQPSDAGTWARRRDRRPP